MMPMAKALVSVIRQMKKAGELPFEFPVGTSIGNAKSATTHVVNLKKRGKAGNDSSKPNPRKSPKRHKTTCSSRSETCRP
jgi:hypothetical protein